MEWVQLGEVIKPVRFDRLSYRIFTVNIGFLYVCDMSKKNNAKVLGSKRACTLGGGLRYWIKYN